MDIKCKFLKKKWVDKVMYTAEIEKQKIPHAGSLQLVGDHFYQKSNAKVTGILFQDCDITTIPKGLKEIFPNIRALAVFKSNLKDISKADLVKYKNLTHLFLMHNKIEYLPGDLFEDLKSLEVIQFEGNELKCIDYKILDGLDKLIYVNFSGNQTYKLYFSTTQEHKTVATLNDVKGEICEVFCKRSVVEIQQLKTEIVQYNADLQGRDAKIQDLINCQVKTFIQRDESFKDFRVKIDDREFLVHKLLLAARCPTIAEMLRQNPQAECLNLVDISVPIFEKILDYFYTGQLPLDEETNFLHLFAAAGQLKVEELKHHVAEKVCGRINAENQLEVLKLGNKYGHNGMVQQAFKEIKKKYPKMKFKNKWANYAEKLTEIIAAYEAKEQKMKEIEENFEHYLTHN